MLDALQQLQVRQEGSARCAVIAPATVSLPVPREGGLGRLTLFSSSTRGRTTKKTSSPFLENNMAYSETIKQTTGSAPKTLGNQLGRWAIKLNFPVIQISQYTGATRQTVYNWFSGTEVTPSYRTSVTNLLRILQTSSTVEEAMKKCNQKK